MIGLYKPEQQKLHKSVEIKDDCPALPAALTGGGRVIILFLRHPGCPFAEYAIKAFKRWQYESAVPIQVVCHGDAKIIKPWLKSIGGLPSDMTLVIDSNREIYGRWGLGYSKAWHFLQPRVLFAVITLWFRGIRNRRASGTRWQRGAWFVVENGLVIDLHLPSCASDFRLPAFVDKVD